MTILHPTCPLCGGTIANDGRVLIDWDGGLVISGHRSAHLTRLEFSVFATLWRNKPKTQSKETLLAASVEPGRDDDREIKLVEQMVHRLRRKLAPLGITIERVWGEGYRIIHEQRRDAA